MRRWLAEKLYPEAFRDAERYHFIRGRISDLHQWCGYEFPQIEAAAVWLLKSARVHFMSLDEYHGFVEDKRFDEVNVDRIDGFREGLRREYGIKALGDKAA